MRTTELATAKANLQNQTAAAKRTQDGRVAKIEGVSFEQVRSALADALRAAYPPASEMSCGPWPEDIFDDRVVYTNEGKLFSEGYTYANGGVTLAGSPTPVVRTYTPVGEASAAAAPPAPAEGGGAPATAPGMQADQKRAAVNQLVKNARASIEALAKCATTKATR